MADIDPQLLFRFNEKFYFDRLLYYPGNVEVLEILQLQAGLHGFVEDVSIDNVYAG